MVLWRTLLEALRGWRAILTGEPGWAEHFALSGPGLVRALVLYFLIAFLSLLMGAGGAGAPDPLGLLVGLLVLGLNIWALAAGVYGVRLLTGWKGPVPALLVPGAYAMSLYLVLGTLMGLISPPLVLLAMVLVAMGLFRLGRVAGGWSAGVSAGFAVFTAILLVVMPMTLYMLTYSDLPAA